MSNFLIFGGSGYELSHLATSLLKSGTKVVLFDNFTSGQREVINRIETIAGKWPGLVVGELYDKPLIQSIITRYDLHNIILPISFLVDHNFYKLECDSLFRTIINLLTDLRSFGVKNFIFTLQNSSKSTLVPDILKDTVFLSQAQVDCVKSSLLKFSYIYTDVKVVIINYYNIVSAHNSGFLGPDKIYSTNCLFHSLCFHCIADVKNSIYYHKASPIVNNTHSMLHIDDYCNRFIGVVRNLDVYENLKEITLDPIYSYTLVQIQTAVYSVSTCLFSDFANNQCKNTEKTISSCTMESIINSELQRICGDMCRWIIMNPTGYVLSKH